MQSKKVFTAAALAVLMSSSLAFAEEAAAPAANADKPAATAPAPGGAEKKAENFADRKTKILEHMTKREEEFKKRQACVQAATSGEALKACFPNRGHWGKKGGKGGPGCKDGDDMPPKEE